MDIGRVRSLRVGPEGFIIKLKLQRPGGIAPVLGNEEEPRFNISRDAPGLQLMALPHRHARLLKPSGGLFEDGRHRLRVRGSCLPNYCLASHFFV